MSVAGREVFDWLPVFDLTTTDVFRIIAEAGQSPHPVYPLGRRDARAASASSLRDRTCAGQPNSVLICTASTCKPERRIGYTLSPTRQYLPNLTGIPAETAASAPVPTCRLGKRAALRLRNSSIAR